MNIPKMTDEEVDRIYKDWLYTPGHANELDLINMAVAARDAQWQAALAEQEPVAGQGKELHDRLIQAIHTLIAARDEPSKWGSVGPDAEDLAWGKVRELVNHICVGIDSPPVAQPEPSTPAAQERANRDADEFSRYTPKEWVSQERAEPVAPAVAWMTPNPYRPELLMVSIEKPSVNGVDLPGARPLGYIDTISATPPAPAQPAINTPEHHAQILDAVRNGRMTFAPGWNAQPSPEPSKPEQAEAPKAGNAEPVARIEFRRGEAGRENEMPRVISCNWLPDGVYEVYLATLPPASAAGERGDPAEAMDDSDRLKPCPFCGHEVECCTMPAEHDDAGAMFVQCTNSACMASSALIYPLMDDPKPLLLERWNRRAALATKPQAATPPAQTVQDKKGGAA